MTSSSSEQQKSLQPETDLDPGQSVDRPSQVEAQAISGTAELTPPPDLRGATGEDHSSPQVIDESPTPDKAQASDGKSAAARRRRIKIGSQRDQVQQRGSVQRSKPKPLRNRRSSKPQAVANKAKPNTEDQAEQPGAMPSAEKTTAENTGVEKSETLRAGQPTPSETPRT